MAASPACSPCLSPLGLAWLAFEQTAFRRNLLAVGGDARAAYASGVNVVAVRIIAYVIGGILAAIAGLVFTARLGSGDPRVGVPYTLTSIAAVALGGVALSGGRGGMLGSAAAGALLVPDPDAVHAGAGVDLLHPDHVRGDSVSRAHAERGGRTRAARKDGVGGGIGRLACARS